MRHLVGAGPAPRPNRAGGSLNGKAYRLVILSNAKDPLRDAIRETLWNPQDRSLHGIDNQTCEGYHGGVKCGIGLDKHEMGTRIGHAAVPPSLIKMKQFGLERVVGPYFDFLVCEKDSYWERRGRVQRIVGIKKEFYHHPDALRLQDSVVSLFSECFHQTHDHFNFFGNTIYEKDSLDDLACCLEKWAQRMRACETEEEFTAMLLPGFVSWGLMRFRSWRKHWPKLRDDIVEGVTSIVQQARQARAEDKVLLVMGV